MSPGVHEIEALYLGQISRAKRWIYAESQYFASRRFCEAMALRPDEPNGPEIVIINPVTAAGWLELIAMDSARAHFVWRFETTRQAWPFQSLSPVHQRRYANLCPRKNLYRR
jgi:hypothetical protein